MEFKHKGKECTCTNFHTDIMDLCNDCPINDIIDETIPFQYKKPYENLAQTQPFELFEKDAKEEIKKATNKSNLYLNKAAEKGFKGSLMGKYNKFFHWNNARAKAVFEVLENTEKKIYHSTDDFAPEAKKEFIEIYTLEFFKQYVEDNRETITPIEFANMELEQQEARRKECIQNSSGNEAVFRMHCIKVIQSFIDEVSTENKVETKLTLKQIALKYSYEGNQITRQNGNEIAKKFGHNSGDKLFQEYTYFTSTANRKGKPINCTAKKLRNKIELIESVIKIIPEHKRQRAIDEVAILINIEETEYK